MPVTDCCLGFIGRASRKAGSELTPSYMAIDAISAGALHITPEPDPQQQQQQQEQEQEEEEQHEQQVGHDSLLLPKDASQSYALKSPVIQ